MPGTSRTSRLAAPRALAQVGQHLGHGGVELVSRNGAIDQSQLGGARRREAVAAQKNLHGFAGSHLGQTHHRDDGGCDAQSDLGEAELHVFGRDRDVEGRRQAVAPAHHVARDAADDRRGGALDGQEQLLEAHARGAALRGPGALLQIGAGAEGVALVGDHYCTHRGAGVGGGEGVVEALHQRAAQGVAVLHVRQGGRHHTVLGCKLHRVHGILPTSSRLVTFIALNYLLCYRCVNPAFRAGSISKGWTM
jgi:hypothetical protein